MNDEEYHELNEDFNIINDCLEQEDMKDINWNFISCCSTIYKYHGKYVKISIAYTLEDLD